MKHKCKIENLIIIPENLYRFNEDLNRFKEAEITIEKWVKRRTDKQNNSIHLYCQILSQEFLARGIDMREIIRDEIPISFTPESVKIYLWKPIQMAMFGKKSTTQLDTHEVSQIHDQLNKIIIERTKGEVSVAFPSVEELLK